MNRTVRNVGGLILMMSRYGDYKGGVTATGNMVFHRMTKGVGSAFGKTKPKPDPNKPDKYGITPGQWKKGVGAHLATFGGIHVPTFDKDGHIVSVAKELPDNSDLTFGIFNSLKDMEEAQREEQHRYIVENNVPKEDIPHVKRAINVFPSY